MASQGAQPKASDFGDAYVAIFNDVDLMRSGKLGMSRLPLHHFDVFNEKNPNERKLLHLQQAATAQGRVVVQAFLPYRDRKGKLHDSRRILWLTGVPAEVVKGKKISTLISDESLGKRVMNFAEASSERDQLRADGYDVYLRRVPYQHAECISCHSEAKVGDTAGVVLIALKAKSGQ